MFLRYTRALFSDAGVVPLFSQQTVTEKYEFVRSSFALCFGSSHSRIEVSPPCHPLSVCVFSLFRKQHPSGVPANRRNIEPQISSSVAEKARLIQRPPSSRCFISALAEIYVLRALSCSLWCRFSRKTSL